MLLVLQVSAQDFDPFAELETEDHLASELSNLTASLSFVFQGNYIPELDLKANNDFYASSSILDAEIEYQLSDDDLFRYRGMVNYIDQKEGSVDSNSAKVDTLEYFYRRSINKKSSYFTIGRKNLGWSTGFQWRPADVIENGFTTKNFDSLDPSRYRGLDQVQYEILDEAYDLAVLVSNHDQGFYNGLHWAAKLGIKGTVDTSLLWAQNGDYSRKYGVVIDSNLPWGTTLALEAVQVEIETDYLLDPDYFGSTLESLSGIDSYRDIYLGLAKYIDDKRRVNLEYFHNGRGFEAGQIDNTISQSISRFIEAGNTDWEVNKDVFSKEDLGRNYVYASYTGYIESYELQFKPSILINLDDGSHITSLTLRKAISDNSELFFKTDFYQKKEGKDLGEISSGIGFNLTYSLYIF